MARKERPSQPSAKPSPRKPGAHGTRAALPPAPAGDGSKKLAARAQKQSTLEFTAWLAGVVLVDAYSPRLGAKLYDEGWIMRSISHAQEAIKAMQPRDPAEEMLAAQLVLTHGRILHLTSLANQQTGVESIRVIHEYIDRASNTYRRLMLALAEYRRPPRAGDTFAVVKQANIAGQQVVQNHVSTEKTSQNATNEQGCSARSQTAPELPVDLGGIGVAPFFRPAGEAVEAVQRPQDASGEAPSQDERRQAR